MKNKMLQLSLRCLPAAEKTINLAIALCIAGVITILARELTAQFIL